MDRMKSYLILTLVVSLLLSPLVTEADGNQPIDFTPIDNPIDLDFPDYIIPDYIRYDGKIADISTDENLFSIWVTDDEEDPYSGMVLYITQDTILLEDESNDFISRDELELGMEITTYYHKDTVMLMTAPPRLGADIIVVRKGENPDLIYVSKFDESLLSSDKSLRLNLSEDTLIIDREGNPIGKEDIVNRHLIVFYTLVAESFPAQTTPNKIILLDKEELEISVWDKISIEQEELKLNSPIYKNSQEVIMVPLRQLAEKLGYQVKWITDTRTVELTKDDYLISLTIGEESYTLKGRPINLGIAPELTNSTTYVPIEFLQSIMGIDLEILETGILNIRK